MKPNDTSRILDAVATDFFPAGVDLLARIKTRYERKTFMQTLRAKPALLILFVLLALTLLSGVAYAVGRSLGYIPGIGLVEQGAPIRVLAEPVTLTRDGVTVTVSEAVLTAEKTVVIFTVDNLPWEAISHNENVAGCSGVVDLRLPDGTILKLRSGEGSMNETRFTYPPIPGTVNEAIFVMPCLRETLPGLAPENWEIPLRFIPAPPDLTVVPVVEIIPTAQPAAAPVQITQAFQVGDDYLIAGTVPGQLAAENWVELRALRVTDASGKEVYIQSPTVDGLDHFDWGFQFKAGTVQFPLTLAFDWVEISPLPEAQAEFEFDAGESPQPDQTWELNQPIELGGRTITLSSVQVVNSDSYQFNFICDLDVTGISAELIEYPALGSGGGGGYGFGRASVTLTYAQLPTGKLKVALSNLTVASPVQTWSTQWSPENPPAATTSLYGISFALDQYIPSESGYYLIGHTNWTDQRIKQVYPALVKAFDASGQELALDTLRWGENASLIEALKPNQWVYHLHGQAFAGAVTLRFSQVGVEFQDPPQLSFDLRPFNFTFSDQNLGVPYKTGIIPLELPGLMARAFKFTYYQEGDLRGFEIALEADPALQNLSFSIESGLDTTGLAGIASGGGSYRDHEDNLLIARVTSNAPMSFPLVLAAQTASLNGNWSTTWAPPAVLAGATPFYAPQACVTLEKWKQAAGRPIPAGLSQRILISRGAVAPYPSLFLVNLDGSDEQPLVFGNGSLSPDGQELVYSNENDRLVLWELASGRKTTLEEGFDPHWSPDGTQIAFNRTTSKGQNIFVMEADGSNPRQLTDQTSYLAIASWKADGKALLIQDGAKIDLLDTITGSRRTLLETEYNPYGSVTTAFSPDGQWLAYLELVPGKLTPGLYLARLDGTEKSLLAQLDYWPVISPRFSPDGKWLAIGVLNSDQPGEARPGLINLESCEVIPLSNLSGEVHEWEP